MSVKCFQCPVKASNNSMSLRVVGGGWGRALTTPNVFLKKIILPRWKQHKPALLLIALPQPPLPPSTVGCLHARHLNQLQSYSYMLGNSPSILLLATYLILQNVMGMRVPQFTERKQQPGSRRRRSMNLAVCVL